MQPISPPKNAETLTTPNRQPYHQPRLEELGDVRDLTLGGTGSSMDSNGDWFDIIP